MRSIWWRFLGAFILLILLAITLSIGVGFYTTQQQLATFVENLSIDEAITLASSLSRAYTTSDDWEMAPAIIEDAGYRYDIGNEEHNAEGDEISNEVDEGFHIDRIRIVIVDINGVVVYDNFGELRSDQIAPVLGGRRNPVVNTQTNQTVGYVYVDVNQDFLATESLGFLRELFYSSAIGALLIAGVALVLAMWLAGRITGPVTALTRATQMIAQQGKTELLAVTSSDELGQMSNAFNQMTIALHRQRDLRKRLMDDISHELNTPLSVIQLEAKGLLDHLHSPTQAANHIIQEVHMLRNLVQDLNWLAETDSGELRLNFEDCAIQHILTAEVERWQPQAQARQIRLALLPLPDLPELRLDPLRISQALGNLIHNALQHTEATGQITLGARSESGQQVTISVKDDGRGIDPAELPYIFDRFYRAAESHSRATGGRGLGLAIAQTIVQAHNGSITISSDGLGKGTIVQFSLPV